MSIAVVTSDPGQPGTRVPSRWRGLAPGRASEGQSDPPTGLPPGLAGGPEDRSCVVGKRAACCHGSHSRIPAGERARIRAGRVERGEILDFYLEKPAAAWTMCEPRTREGRRQRARARRPSPSRSPYVGLWRDPEAIAENRVPVGWPVLPSSLVRALGLLGSTLRLRVWPTAGPLHRLLPWVCSCSVSTAPGEVGVTG